MQAAGIRFGGYRLDSVTRQLFGPGGEPVALTGRAFDVLAHLVAHRDRVVGREELLSSVWAGRVVEENNLTQAIAALRRAFGTDANDRRFVLTVTGRGYRFVAPVDAEEEVGALPAAVAAGAPPSNTPRPRPHAEPWARGWGRGIAATALVLLALAAVLAWRRGLQPPPEAPAIQPARLAVLPFRAIGAAQNDELLELGLAETLITRLGHVRDLHVLSLGAVEPFVGKVVDPVRTGHSLGADYVVEGSTQRMGNSVRVNARLLSLRDGRSLWTGTFDAHPERVFTLQDTLAKAVYGALSLRPPSTVAYRSPCDGGDALAYRDYLHGRHLMFRPDPVRLPMALAAFDQALARDPACARAWAGKAFAYRSLAMVGDQQPGLAFNRARAAVQQALRIDPGSAEAHASKGVIEFWSDWDWAAAEASLRHAIALDPNLAEAHYALAHLLHNIGRNEEGLPHARRAALLNPLSPVINAIGASFLVTQGQLDEAERRLDAVLQLDPDFWTAQFWKSRVRARRGDTAGAIASMERAAAACRRCSHAVAGLAWLRGQSGDERAAAALLGEMQARAAHGYFPATRLALAYQGMGRTEDALAALERAYAERDLYLTFLLVDDRLAGLRDEPRFLALAARLRLPAGDARHPAMSPAQPTMGG